MRVIVNIDVPDLDRAVAFYRDAVGLQLTRVIDSDVVELAAARAVRAGAVRESACIEWRGSRCVTLSDPFGHGFCFIEFDAETYTDDS